MKIVPFLGDPDGGGMVIFRTEQEGKPSAYIWVKAGEAGSERGIRVTNFYGLVSYFSQVEDPLVVYSKAEQKDFDAAMERLEKCPKEHLEKLFEAFNRDIEAKQKDDDDWKEYTDWEEQALKVVQEAEKSETGEVIF